MNQIFWPTGNPSPSNRRERRAGDNLYSNSLLALNADSGKLDWYFQFTKHDEQDWDATQVPVLIDAGGKKLIAQTDRSGYFYVIDRSNGKLLSSTAYAKTSWSDSKDGEGRPVANKKRLPTFAGNDPQSGILLCKRHAIGNLEYVPTLRSDAPQSREPEKTLTLD